MVYSMVWYGMAWHGMAWLSELFGVERNGCTDLHSGIGNVSHVKDILTDTVVTKTFQCSKFGSPLCMAWHGMAWHGMAWHGMAWHGMAWHGMV